MVEKLKVLPFTNKDTSVKESILILDRNHKDKVNALPINLKLSRFMIFLDQNFIIEKDLKRVIILYPSLEFQGQRISQRRSFEREIMFRFVEIVKNWTFVIINRVLSGDCWWFLIINFIHYDL